VGLVQGKDAWLDEVLTDNRGLESPSNLKMIFPSIEYIAKT
jgi:hypothetical protein